MKTLHLLLLLLPISILAQNDTINVLDSNGSKQGHWVFFGDDFPNSGVASNERLEEGDYIDNQKVGLWYRYGAGAQVKSIMLFHIDKKTNVSVRDQFYNYQYHSNGQLKRKPIIGKCRSMSDYYLYDEAAQLLEIELFDSICNTAYKLQRIKKGELDSVSIFLIDDQLTLETNATGVVPKSSPNFDQSGEFCVDYSHQLFQIGMFEKGKFMNGREYFLDEMMRLQSVSYFENGKLVKRLVKKTV